MNTYLKKSLNIKFLPLKDPEIEITVFHFISYTKCTNVSQNTKAILINTFYAQ